MSGHECDDALTNLYQYLDREMEEATSTVIRAHLEDCSGCLKSFDFEARLQIVVKERLAEPQNKKNAAKQIYDGACKMLGVENDLEKEEEELTTE